MKDVKDEKDWTSKYDCTYKCRQYVGRTVPEILITVQELIYFSLQPIINIFIGV